MELSNHPQPPGAPSIQFGEREAGGQRIRLVTDLGLKEGLSIMFAMSRVLGSFNPVAPIDHWQKNLKYPQLLFWLKGIRSQVSFCPKPPGVDHRKQRIESIIKGCKAFFGIFNLVRGSNGFYFFDLVLDTDFSFLRSLGVSFREGMDRK